MEKSTTSLRKTHIQDPRKNKGNAMKPQSTPKKEIPGHTAQGKTSEAKKG
jgi:hypothetical protein